MSARIRENITDFSTVTSERLQNYVYRLIDPRNGETFYVGRGKGNRVFQHAADAIKGDPASSEDDAEKDQKLERIKNIQHDGFEVGYIIHRHGMSEEVAKEVEAALIDAYPGLTNLIAGSGSGDRGIMHARAIIQRYQAEPATITHKVLLISVNQSIADTNFSEYELYKAARWAWRLDKKRVEKVELVLAVVQGIIRGVFIPEKWMLATAENFPGNKDEPGRIGFKGHSAPEDIQKQYVRKRLPDGVGFGSGNPVRYVL